MSVLTGPVPTALLVLTVLTVTVTVTPERDLQTLRPAQSAGAGGRPGVPGLVQEAGSPGDMALQGHSARADQTHLVISPRTVPPPVTDLLVQDTPPSSPTHGHPRHTPGTRLGALVSSVLQNTE